MEDENGVGGWVARVTLKHILVSRASVPFGHLVSDILRRVALGTRMTSFHSEGTVTLCNCIHFYTTILSAMHDITTHVRVGHVLVVSFT